MSSFSWLSSPPNNQNQQQRGLSSASNNSSSQHPHQQSRNQSVGVDISRFQNLKQQLENFREATDPKIAATLGFAESGFAAAAAPQGNRHNEQNHSSSSSDKQKPSDLKVNLG